MDVDCCKWLQNNSSVIKTILGESQEKGYVAVGDFGVSTANAVAGVSGTDLETGYSLLTVNLQGAFFNSDRSTDSGRIAGGSDEAKAFILLHEIAHLTQAAGFQENDSAPAIQLANNDLVHDNCQKM